MPLRGESRLRLAECISTADMDYHRLRLSFITETETVTASQTQERATETKTVTVKGDTVTETKEAVTVTHVAEAAQTAAPAEPAEQPDVVSKVSSSSLILLGVLTNANDGRAQRSPRPGASRPPRLVNQRVRGASRMPSKEVIRGL